MNRNCFENVKQIENFMNRKNIHEVNSWHDKYDTLSKELNRSDNNKTGQIK